FRKWMSKLNDVVYQKVGVSIIDEVYNEAKSKSDHFDRLLYTHPAIFMVEYSLARVLIESGFEPDYVLGTSLGEFTSAAVAGVISVEEMLEIILKQAELIERYCEIGSMIAIIDSFNLYHQSSAISLHSNLAAFNYSSHFIIAGESVKLLKIEEYLKTRNLVFQALPVRYGFHSSNIDPIENEYKMFLSKFLFEKPKIPVISCLLSGCVTNFSAQYFWDIIRQPICFQKTIIKLEEQGQFNYIDLGPSGTLANFVRKNLSKDSFSQAYDVLNPFGQDVKKIEKIKESFY
ncbi:MAG: 6-deoxyerythronolide-B synthase, partial [Firmicutes bacterium]|nr:6-deoxyerythronolide-B synthase [Bacillota bacterium]